jgi:Double zinc ribbon
MLAQFVVGVISAAAAVWFVLRPVFRPAVATAGAAEPGAGDEGDDPADDLSPRAVALRALREIEFDRATGKLSDADYDALQAKYTAEALAALRDEDAGRGTREAGQGTHRETPAPKPRAPRPACPTHGPRPEPDAAFCSECGRRLGAAPGYCARCGSALEHEARYCHGCGARVAA